MGIPTAVSRVRVGAVGERIEYALDVVFLDGGEEGFIGGGVVGLRIRYDRGDVGAIDVFSGDEAEALIAGCGLSGGFGGVGKVGFPDHIGDAVADLEQAFDDVRGEGLGVESQGADFGDVSAERAVDARAFDANDDAQVDADPFDFSL